MQHAVWGKDVDKGSLMIHWMACSGLKSYSRVLLSGPCTSRVSRVSWCIAGSILRMDRIECEGSRKQETFELYLSVSSTSFKEHPEKD